MLSWTEAASSALATLAAAVASRPLAGPRPLGDDPDRGHARRDGEPVGPALTWEDCRAHAEASEITWQSGEREAYAQTGQPLDGRYLLPMFAWMARHDPERAAHHHGAQRQGLPLQRGSRARC